MDSKTAIITGGASGIGLAFSEILLQHGLKKLHILDWNKAVAETKTKSLNKKYGASRVSFHHCNVADFSQYQGVVKVITKESPKIDIWINNAGVTNEEDIIPVNLMGTIYGIKLAMATMSKEKGGAGGVIINTASHMGLMGLSFFPSYVASKWGVIGLTKSYGKTKVYDQTGVKIMAICPGSTITTLAQNLDVVEKVLNEVRDEGYRVENQSPENVAKGLMRMLQEDIHGSIWVSENNEEVYRIEHPKYTDLKV